MTIQAARFDSTRAASPTPCSKGARNRSKRSSPLRATSSSRWRKARAPSRRSPCERKRGRAPLFFNLDSARSRHDGNQRRHGQGASRDDRPRHDGMQEGPGRGGRRPGEGRGAAAHQERRQSEPGGGAGCGRGAARGLPLARGGAGGAPGSHVGAHRRPAGERAGSPADTVGGERNTRAARAGESGKPAAIAAKMVEGALSKFLGEITLLGQPFIKDDKQSIEKMLAARKASVNAYAFLVVGEGIAKSVH